MPNKIKWLNFEDFPAIQRHQHDWEPGLGVRWVQECSILIPLLPRADWSAEERAGSGGGAKEVVVVGWMLLCCSAKPERIIWGCWRVTDDSQLYMAIRKKVQCCEKAARTVCLALFFLCDREVQAFKNGLILVRFSWEGNFKGGFAQERQALPGEQERRTKENNKKRDVQWKKTLPLRWWCKPESFSSRNCFHYQKTFIFKLPSNSK